MRTSFLKKVCVAAASAAFVLGLVLWASSAQAAPKDEKSNTNEVSQIVETDCNLTDEQKEKIAKIKEAKDKDITAKREMIDKAKQNLDSIKEKRKRELAEDRIKAAEKQMEAFERSWDPKFIAVLKPDQKTLLFNKLMDNRIKDEFTGISFTEEQSGKIKKLVENAAKNAATSGALGPAQLRPVFAEISGRILTKDQRDDYLKFKAQDAKKNRK